MLMLGLNLNQIDALSNLSDRLVMEDYFQVQLRHDNQDKRVLVARFYKVGQPGWIEYDIDQNGDIFHETTGGLD